MPQVETRSPQRYEILSAGRRRLRPGRATASDVVAEGFPELTRAQFVEFFCATHRGVSPDSEMTRIEWVYPRLDGDDPATVQCHRN